MPCVYGAFGARIPRAECNCSPDVWLVEKEDRIANSLIADKTRLAVKHASEAVLSLAYRNIIKVRRIGQTRYIGINTCLDAWAYTKPKCPKCPVSFPVAEVVTQVITSLKLGIAE
jgi:hypothetical protein